MSIQTVKLLLDALRIEIEETKLESESIAELRLFEQEIEPYLDGNIVSDTASVASLLEQAQELEVRFAQEHPAVEGIVRQISNTLSGMGI